MCPHIFVSNGCLTCGGEHPGKLLAKHPGELAKHPGELAKHPGELAKHPGELLAKHPGTGSTFSKHASMNVSFKEGFKANELRSNADGIPSLLSGGHTTINDAEMWLLQQHKLILLIDLDQTLVHTISAKLLKDSEDLRGDFHIHSIAHPNGETELLCSTIRPLAREFLRHLNTYFELYICTLGTKEYACNVMNILDPTGKLIKPNHSFSRGDFPNKDHKASILLSKFQYVFKMVVVIDDNWQVWDSPGCYAYNLICVHPYFGQEIEQRDDVEYLRHLAKHLQKVHQVFYTHYNKFHEVASTDEIVYKLKKQVLNNLNVVFSHIIPSTLPKDLALCIRLATDFGAYVKDSVDHDTHCIISGDPTTEKCMQAHRLNVPVVHANWLGYCSEYWQRPAFSDFVLTEINKPTLFLKNKEMSIFQRPNNCEQPREDNVSLQNVRTSEKELRGKIKPEVGDDSIFLDEDDDCVLLEVVKKFPKQPIDTITLSSDEELDEWDDTNDVDKAKLEDNGVLLRNNDIDCDDFYQLEIKVEESELR